MQKSDILLGIGVVAVVVMLIIPLPTFLLDFLLAISIMSGLLILMIVMFIGRTFDFSIFPTLLLITTVFRLALILSPLSSAFFVERCRMISHNSCR